MTPVAQLILNNPSWVSYAVILTAFGLWVIKGTNEPFLLFILSYYWILSLLSVIPGVEYKELKTFVAATLIATLEHFFVVSFIFFGIALLAINWVLPAWLLYHAYTRRLILRLNPQLLEFIQFPKRRFRATVLAILVWIAMAASVFASLIIPGALYRVYTSYYSYPQQSTSSSIPHFFESLSAGQWVLNSINEEILRAALFTSSLTNPVLNTLLWVLAHRHEPERMVPRLEARGIDTSQPNIQAYLRVTTYTYALAMFINGLALLWLIRTTGSIWPAALSHFLYNLLVGVT
jgi:membrane protease YdiL (CAAX protease family)